MTFARYIVAAIQLYGKNKDRVIVVSEIDDSLIKNGIPVDKSIGHVIEWENALTKMGARGHYDRLTEKHTRAKPMGLYPEEIKGWLRRKKIL